MIEIQPKDETERKTWQCPYCLFNTNDVNLGLVHIEDHETGHAIAMTDAQITKAVGA
jgi:hypothetical protein